MRALGGRPGNQEASRSRLMTAHQFPTEAMVVHMTAQLPTWQCTLKNPEISRESNPHPRVMHSTVIPVHKSGGGVLPRAVSTALHPELRLPPEGNTTAQRKETLRPHPEHR